MFESFPTVALGFYVTLINGAFSTSVIISTTFSFINITFTTVKMLKDIDLTDLNDKNDNNNQFSKYLISPDCNSCDETSEYQTHFTGTTYWMTGNLAKLHWGVIGFNECDMDWDTYQCYDCEACLSMAAGCEATPYTPTSTDFKTSGICGVTVQDSNHYVYKDREMAQQSAGVNNYKPSIGTQGEFCVCYQPSANADEHYLTDEQEDIIETRQNSDKKNKNKNKNKQAQEEKQARQQNTETQQQQKNNKKHKSTKNDKRATKRRPVTK